MKQPQRWGTDEQGVPRAWFAPLVFVVILVAPLLVQLVVHSSVTRSAFAGALTFAVVFAALTEANRRRLRAAKSQDSSWGR